MSTPSAPLTRESYLKMSTEELKRIVHDPQKLLEANALLGAEVETPVVLDEQLAITPEPTPEPTAEDIAAAETATAEKAEGDRIAAEAAEAEADKASAKAALELAYKNAGISVETDANGNITKIIKRYQTLDESGAPIGRPTYLEATSWLELSVKEKAAHEHAVRYGERVKKQQVTKKKDTPSPVQTLTEAELLKLQDDLKSEDRDAAEKAAEKIRRNDEVKRFTDAEVAIENARQAQVSYKFLSKHISDYNNCLANNKLIDDYIKDNQLEWTEDNLEVALNAVESQLAPKEQPAAPEPINPVPVPPAPVAPPPAIVAPPAPPAASIPTPSAPRPGVNGGLVPGAQSAPRPTGQPKGLTKKDIKDMPPAEYRRRLKDPKFVAEVNALRIKGGL